MGRQKATSKVDPGQPASASHSAPPASANLSDDPPNPPDLPPTGVVDERTAGAEVAAGESAAPCDAAGQADDTNALSGDAAQGPPSVEQLTRDLEGARKIADEQMEAVLRVRAELDNVRKRAERDVANAHRYGVERLVEELLPVQDSLELGSVAAADQDVELEQVREGMDLTIKMMAAVLDKVGVAELNPVGEAFDPTYHQAMSMQESQGSESGSVILVVQKGYLLNDRLVRPALVIVAK